MSEILETINAAGDNLIDGKGIELLDGLLKDGEALAAEKLPPELQGVAIEGLAILGEDGVKTAAANLTKRGLATVIGLFGEGGEEDKKDAHRIYIESEATAAERIEFQAASGDAAELLYAKRSAEWDALTEALERIGTVALKAIGSLVLGMIGL